ncbi:MAG: T9SS type A sorting domain-containing protein [Bacteroidota bacterium]|nr:T9SS type A sorting domain-containing protein [Bacteroidota bacterium]
MNSQSGVVHIDSILSGGLMRKYRLYVPNSYTSANPVPLVFNLHGYTSNASQQESYANFMPIADTAKFLVLSPDGTSQFGNQFWNAGFGYGPNDVQFISDLIDSVKLTYNIDLNSIYSCGMSNGGIMSYYLACNLPNRIAAIASVTGDMLNTWFTCAPSRAFPIMEIHGTLDGTVPYNGDATFAPIDSVVKKWRIHNNCSVSPITFSVPNISMTDNSTAVNYKYIGGTNGSSVELYKVTGGSHSWPGALPVILNTNQDFKASVEIWRFFRQYKLNQFIPNVGIINNLNKDNSVLIFPNPASSFILIKSEITTIDFEILNDLGQKIYVDFNKNETSTTIDIRKLPEGIYFLKVNANHNLVSKRIIKL